MITRGMGLLQAFNCLIKKLEKKKNITGCQKIHACALIGLKDFTNGMTSHPPGPPPDKQRLLNKHAEPPWSTTGSSGAGSTMWLSNIVDIFRVVNEENELTSSERLIEQNIKFGSFHACVPR